MASDPVLVGPQVEQALRWLLWGLVTLAGTIVALWAREQHMALKRIPPKEWFEEVKSVMRARSTREEHNRLAERVTRVERTSENHELRLETVETNHRNDHARLGKAEDDVRDVKTELEIRGGRP